MKCSFNHQIDTYWNLTSSLLSYKSCIVTRLVTTLYEFFFFFLIQPKLLLHSNTELCTVSSAEHSFNKCYYCFSSVQFSRSVVSDSLQPHESQHARPPCPSPTPKVHSNSRPLSSWCHPAISSSVVPFSSCPQSLPASESFPMSQLFAWGGQSTGVSQL